MTRRASTQAKSDSAGRVGPGARTRVLLAATFFLGLGVLEVGYAFGRLAEGRERQRADALRLFDRQQERLAAEISDLLGDGTRHASYLARSPVVREALLRPDEAAREQRLGAVVLPYLASFRGIDQLCLLDAAGVERFRCERVGGGVALLPRDFLATEPRDEILRQVRDVPPGDVVISELLHDESRVEVDAEHRSVFHYATALRDGARPLGIVVVTVYAASILDALQSFEAAAGVRSWLLDEGGDVYAAPAGDDPEAHAAAIHLAIDSRELVWEADDAVFLTRPIGKAPCSWLVSRVPEDTLAAGEVEFTREALVTMLRMTLVLAAIALGGALVARASQRESRLRETEQYLQRIREESAKQRALMEAAADLILIVAPDAKQLRDTNERARAFFGFAAAAGSRPLADLEHAFGGEGLRRVEQAVARAAREPGQAVVVANLSVRGRDGDGLIADARCIGLDLGASGAGPLPERLVEIALSDRTREIEMERRVQVSERLSSLGLLTAGVAHEINNPLEGITNYLALLEHSQDEHKRAGYVAELRTGLGRIRDIVGDLVGFARHGEERGTADLSAVVERVLSLGRLSRDLKDVRVDVEGLDLHARVLGSEGRLEQVLLNLLLNAGRAMQGRGAIRVSVRAEGDAAWRMDVADEGPGIDPADLPHLFDPFFTRSGGTGLGLSIAYGIVRALGGELTAANRPDGGALFSILLPRAEPPSNGSRAGVASTEDRRHEHQG